MLICIKEIVDRFVGVGNIVVVMLILCYMLILFFVVIVMWYFMGKFLERWIEGFNNKKVLC